MWLKLSPLEGKLKCWFKIMAEDDFQSNKKTHIFQIVNVTRPSCV